jgi:ABC-2 type transport system permease protein
MARASLPEASAGAPVPAFRRTPAAAWEQALTLLKMGLQIQLAYREELISQWAGIVVQIVVFRQLWRALYAARDAVGGVSLGQALTYITITIVVTRFFSTWLVEDVNAQIGNGDISLMLARPIPYGYAWFLHTAGEAVAGLLLVSLPVAVVMGLALALPLPGSPLVWLAFSGSLLLGFLTSFYIDYLLALLAFWLTDVGGLIWSKGSIISILGGTYLPLWIYPPAVAAVLLWLPFRGIAYTPVAILIGEIGPGVATLQALALQAGWVVILGWLSHRIFRAGVKRLSVQGG